MDSLDSKFTSSLASAATILLRAINNRKYIFALTLKYDYDRLTSYNEKMEIQESKLFMLLLPDARNELLESQNISYGGSRMRNDLSSKYVGPIPIYFVQNFMLFQMGGQTNSYKVLVSFEIWQFKNQSRTGFPVTRASLKCKEVLRRKNSIN